MRLLITFLLSLTLSAQTVLPNTLGEQKTLVILVNFQDKADQPFTVSYANDVVFNQTNAFYLENSYNQTWLTGSVMGWYTIPSSYTTCDILTIASQAKSAAQSAGVNLADYQHLVYMFPANACAGWFARGTIGGNPSEMWIKGQPNFTNTAHEFGHNLGLWHSKSLDCGIDVVCTNGTVDEYGDVFDLMAHASTAHFNLYQKERLGWVNLTTVASYGDYAIDNYETISLGSKGLKIAKAPGQWYYVEKRSAYGFDSFLSNNSNVANGVLIHFGNDSGDLSPYLLDMTPPNYWFDPALTVGRSFVDAQADLGITLLSVNSTGAVVRVTCAACVPPPDNTPPVVSITSPLSQVTRNTTVSIQATASDNVAVDRVEVSVNNSLLCSDNSVPYSCSWVVPGKKNASYTLTAKAYDGYGNVGTYSITVGAK